MLHLKRASAGSGKTYELAKTYIRYLLTVKEPGKRRLLRKNPNALPEAMAGIMAVTFTVKATAEMKQRIIEKLAALAKADEIAPDKLGEIDYLEDFMKEFNATKDRIAIMAQAGLRTLLLHFSDFRVQTIDSFFQGILHTFAYEASIDENFNMEIDSDYVSTVGFDAALDAISSTAGTTPEEKETLYWLRKMVDVKKGSTTWNFFARSANEQSIYQTQLSEAKKLEKEDFKKKRREIEEYFESLKRPFSEVVEELDVANLGRLPELHKARWEAAQKLKRELRNAGLDPRALTKSGQAKELRQLKFNLDFDKLAVPPEVIPRKANKGYSLGAAVASTPYAGTIDSAFDEWKAATDAFREELMADPLRIFTWIEYRRLLPSLMVVLAIARKRREFLEATNTLLLSDTSEILAEIIGEDDTPFVYERMGTRLNHYLIDEFQDTSRMQWHNFLPLLHESESRGQDNLVIGDAKQSIYRFRNADYRLITDEVEKEFARKVVPYAGDIPPTHQEKENTNYRSKLRVVEFNNFVFANIIGMEGSNSNQKEATPFFNKRIEKIYKDAVQAVPKKTAKEKLGFVEVNFYPSLSNEEMQDYPKIGDESMGQKGFLALPQKIMELRRRGYLFREIGVLVKSRNQGKVAVRTIALHNDANPDEKIPVISEDNLLVASSLSVRLIIHALEMAAKGVAPAGDDKEIEFGPINGTRLFELLGALQSPALPSVVEAIVAEFIPEERRNHEAPFIAAFQDAVVDYCTSFTSDIDSFLKWWKRKGLTLSINSPEESDGVRVLTIHKSKGLEYPCVIIPKANFSFIPGSKQSEWRWVRPDACVEGAELLPPYLPVETKSRLAQTAHAALWDEYCEEVGLDEINKMYVGLTRAKNELYIYAQNTNKIDGKDAPAALKKLLEEAMTTQEELKTPLALPIQKIEPEGEDSDGILRYRYGLPLTPEQIVADRKEKAKKGELLNEYPVHSNRRVLRVKDSNDKLIRQDESEPALDPRAEGTLKHRIMQTVDYPSDLDKALKEMKVSGLISSRQAREWGDQLREAIASVETDGWFAKGNRILNERTLMRNGTEHLRPDRIIVRPDGTAVIIDYKFGAKKKEYRQQVKNYADRLVATGKFPKVEAYLWYVSGNEKERVV